MGISDTPPEVERIVIEGLRRLTPSERLERVFSLNRALDSLMRAAIVGEAEGPLSEDQITERVAARYLDEPLLTAAIRARAKRANHEDIGA